MAASPRISTDIPTADHGPTIAGQGPCIAAKAATYIRLGSFASARCALNVRATSALLRKRSTSCDTASDRGLVFAGGPRFEASAAMQAWRAARARGAAEQCNELAPVNSI